MSTTLLYADVTVPLALHHYFTYSIPQAMSANVQIGSRVVVQFGQKKYYTAIVVSIHHVAPAAYPVKPITSLLDERPILRHPQLKLWEWMASYYMCSVGEVYKAALPAGLKLESETQVMVNDEYVEQEDMRHSGNEQKVLDALAEQPRQSVMQLEKITGIKNLLPVVRKLIEREAIFLSESIQYKYRPKQQSYVRLLIDRADHDRMRQLFDELARSKKQLSLLMKLLEMSRFMQRGDLVEVSKKELLDQAQVTSAVLKSLEQKEVVEVYHKVMSRLETAPVYTQSLHDLNPAQTTAIQQIYASFQTKAVTLLHGVTSSGKTEVYMHLIQDMIQQGRQVLLLVPEIALTTQLSARLERVFGTDLAIYHSKFSDNERVEIWNRLLETDEVKVVVGVRSAVFLPFKNLGLVIVDEEHEPTFKQQDPAPRYHGRNVAIVLAGLHGAKTLLGTATPSIESYFNAQQGKYGFVQLTARHQDIALPIISAVDVHELKRKKMMVSHFSPLLMTKIDQSLQRGEQAILFQNRRGFAPMIECQLCAWVPRCQHCDVSLTYHKGRRELTCHYCGYTTEVPVVCPACGNPDITPRGFGTEKIEEEVTRLFPAARVARMDLDTTRQKKAYEKIITAFQQQKSNVMVGTQMISKGLDFEHVRVVGILNADGMMNYPDFRAHERAFQMMTQVAGRAGRQHGQGEVVLQTSHPDHPLIRQVINGDYQAMYQKELAERRDFNYPPFCRLIYIYMKHRNEAVLNELSHTYAKYLCSIFGSRVLGPDNPPVARVQSLYIRKIVLKVELDASIQRAKELLLSSRTDMMRDERFKSLQFYYDVDPI